MCGDCRATDNPTATTVNIEAPIPKLEVQQRVVKVIEEQFAAYEGVRQLKGQTEATMRRIVRGLFGLRDEGSEL